MLFGFVYVGEGVVYEVVGEGLFGGEFFLLGFEGLYYVGVFGGGEFVGDVSGGVID